MWRRIWAKRWSPWANTLLFLCGILLAMSASSGLAKGHEQRVNAVRAEATVTKVNHLAATSWNLRIEEPRQFTVRHASAFQHDPRVGERVIVYYSALHPTDQDMVTDVHLGPPGGRLIRGAKFALMAALVPIGLAIFGHTRRRGSPFSGGDMSAVRAMGGLD
ncbi:hypothetical protein [Actinomadura sp. NTSP31]|uniref:hypothetical protein n=1 Tax=Actinomadura sp. NTSP31 TaxID=1735447 RepID=UPI0035C05085